MNAIDMISIVIPVHNEERNLRGLLEGILAVMSELGKKYEIIFVDDGSDDGSLNILKNMAAAPGIKVVEMAHNVGQHAAILAGFSIACGDVLITMDADLQNPPGEIPKLVNAMERGGYDVVGTIRRNRQDTAFRLVTSKIANSVIGTVTKHQVSDWGCMMRAYRRNIANDIVACRERPVFIPSLACRFTDNMTEIEIEHQKRYQGKSNYSIISLLKLTCDFALSVLEVPSKLAMFSAPKDDEDTLIPIKEIHALKISGDE